MRALLSGLLVLASLVLGTAAFSAAWLERNVVAAEGFAELGEPLGRDPGFQAELREALAQQAADSANVPGPLAGLVAPAVERVLQGLQEAPGYGEAWTESLEASQTQAVIGTAQYLSPERARGETVDARSDRPVTGNCR